MKRFFAIFLCISMLLGLCACGGTAAPSPSESEPAPTEAAGIPKKDSLKVLTLGHSLTVDANHMLALVANAEGYTGLEINIALESINNALKTPLAVTQSQYTVAPEGYVAK